MNRGLIDPAALTDREPHLLRQQPLREETVERVRYKRFVRTRSSRSNWRQDRTPWLECDRRYQAGAGPLHEDSCGCV